MDHNRYGSHSGFLFHELLKQELPSGEGRRNYAKGESIFNEGQQAYGLFCILSGKVKILRSGDSGKDQILRLAGSRDVIGYRALLADETYKASAVALEDTSVGYVPKKIFFDILNSNPEISRGMMKLLSKDLERSESQMVDIATKSVIERVAEVLLLLKESYGFKADGQTLDMNLKREDLANMVGTATEVFIRQLARLKEDKLVDTLGRSIRLLDIPGLLRVARLHE